MQQENDFRVNMLLADFVRTVQGKLDALGMGWDIHTVGAPIGVGIVVEIPWSQTNRRHSLSLTLEDADGHPVMMPTPDQKGFRELRVDSEFEAGRPLGTQEGTRISFPLAINIHQVPLEPNRRYTFTAYINNRTMPEWQRSFSVRSAPMRLAS